MSLCGFVICSFSLLYDSLFCENTSFLVYSSAARYLGSSHFGAIINNIAMNILMYVFWLRYVGISFGEYSQA